MKKRCGFASFSRRGPLYVARHLVTSQIYPASYAGRARRRACERRVAAAGWQVPAEPTMPRLNSQVLGFQAVLSAGSAPPAASVRHEGGFGARSLATTRSPQLQLSSPSAA